MLMEEHKHARHLSTQMMLLLLDIVCLRGQYAAQLMGKIRDDAIDAERHLMHDVLFVVICPAICCDGHRAGSLGNCTWALPFFVEQHGCFAYNTTQTLGLRECNCSGESPTSLIGMMCFAIREEMYASSTSY